MLTEKQFFDNLRNVLSRGWVEIPDYHGYRGTGGVGIILNELLGCSNNNEDIPNSSKWEVKFHSGKAPLTLFHKTPEPRGVMRAMVHNYGWPTENGLISFRHTIWGESPLGFKVCDDSQRVIVRKERDSADIIPPYWTYDTLYAAFAGKMRRLVVVNGITEGNRALYQNAYLYTEPRITQFVSALTQGIIAIDFDARTTESGGIRDHGTKFRIKMEDIGHLYSECRPFNP
ncbi:TPA: MvaI/BcnI family restriction endonuclease [Proteus mirabilis]|uniref:MvaI/BcnI family restriction endonuclease n=1 Tax=Proteus mirabilis TaxID=584 RepID=UPI001629495C|nr:MvaI/BcnI family restriction endonuclease [Proteus mirabilis]MBB6687628.1 hypothetical protein [Proteus mirabilis]